MDTVQKAFYQFLKENTTDQKGQCALSEKSLREVSENIELVTFRKNDTLQKEGTVAEWMYTISEGIVREHVLRDDGVDISIMFHEAPVGTGSLWSYQEGIGCLYSLSAISDGSAYRIRCDVYADLLETNVDLSMWYAKLLRENCIKMQRHIIDMTCRTSEERLRYLMENKPSLMRRVPATQLATYLNMTPVSFSRAKKSILASKSGN